MIKESIFDQDRKEQDRYLNVSMEEEVLLPITKAGFESMLDVCAKYYDLPVDDSMRMVIAGYIHHIENEKNQVTLIDIAKVMYKSISNALTWDIDQKIKEQKREELKLREAKSENKSSKDNIVPIQ